MLNRRGRPAALLGGLVAAVTAVVLAVTTVPAAATVAPFQPRVTVGLECYDAFTRTSPTGVTRGVMACSSNGTSELVFFHGDGNSWARVSTGVAGSPVAFADDGTSYFALYEPPNAKGAVKLLKRNHSTGSQTKITIRASTAATEFDWLVGGDIIASGGRYWVAYTINNAAILIGQTRTKQNLVPSLPATMPAVWGWEPSLARRGPNSVVMVLDQAPPYEGGMIVRYGTHADGTWGRTILRQAAGGRSPQVIWKNGVTQVSWLEQRTTTDYRVVYQENSTGIWKRTTVPGLVGRLLWPRLRMAASGGKVTVAYSGIAPTAPTGDSQIVVSTRSGGAWSTTEFGNSANANRLMSLGSWNGKAIVLFVPTRVGGLCSRRQA